MWRLATIGGFKDNSDIPPLHAHWNQLLNIHLIVCCCFYNQSVLSFLLSNCSSSIIICWLIKKFQQAYLCFVMLSNQNYRFFVKYWHKNEKLGPRIARTALRVHLRAVTWPMCAVKTWKYVLTYIVELIDILSSFKVVLWFLTGSSRAISCFKIHFNETLG